MVHPRLVVALELEHPRHGASSFGSSLIAARDETTSFLDVVIAPRRSTGQGDECKAANVWPSCCGGCRPPVHLPSLGDSRGGGVEM
jgi:hypothetical protein